MKKQIQAIQGRIMELEKELEEEVSRAKEKFFYTISERKIQFDKSVIAYHKKLRKSWLWTLMNAGFINVLVSPLTYLMIFPLAILDLFAFAFQSICFPAYGIKKVPRADFIVIDRHQLKYLNIFEKFNCMYCGYATGLMGYAREIAARTEEYWCPIKHAHRIKIPHSRYRNFEEYGDGDGYAERLSKFYDK